MREAKILLFKSFCSNVYCCCLWCSYNASFLDKVRVVYNNSFRILLKLPKFCSASNMFVERRVPSFGEMLRKCRNTLHYRLRKSENTILRDLFNSDIYYKSKLFCLINDSTSVASV